MFEYEATQADELTIKFNDIVEVISEEEPGWYVRTYLLPSKVMCMYVRACTYKYNHSYMAS